MAEHDPHEKKRKKEVGDRQETVLSSMEPITAIVALPTSTFERVTSNVEFPTDAGDVYAGRPTEIMALSEGPSI